MQVDGCPGRWQRKAVLREVPSTWLLGWFSSGHRAEPDLVCHTSGQKVPRHSQKGTLAKPGALATPGGIGLQLSRSG